MTNHQQPSYSFAAKAYKLFSNRRASVELAITLKLWQPRVSKMYKEH
jgi:hypothetical protein